MTAPLNTPRTPPYKLAGAILTLIAIVILVLAFMQFRGDFLPRTQLTMLSGRAGLSMEPGAKVTFNGVEIGRVADIVAVESGGRPEAKFTLDVDPKYLKLIPVNVDARINATTVFGNKYVSLSTPEDPSPQRISKDDVIDASGVTTEFNTLFETVVDVSKKVDPVKLNQTLSAAATALDGMGDKFGESIVQGNRILADLNAQMPQIQDDTRQLADLTEVYADASPDLWSFLSNSVITIRTLNEQQGNLDAALMASIGFGNTGADIFERGGPYLQRGLEDLVPTSEVLDRNMASLFCTIRNYHDVAPKVAASLGGNGYSLKQHGFLVGAANPYVYPDNLPRANARGGPLGEPGCWAPVTRDLWPAPYMVMDTGVSIAPYNHFELGQPLALEYVWGRQIGENTINP